MSDLLQARPAAQASIREEISELLEHFKAKAAQWPVVEQYIQSGHLVRDQGNWCRLRWGSTNMPFGQFWSGKSKRKDGMTYIELLNPEPFLRKIERLA